MNWTTKDRTKKDILDQLLVNRGLETDEFDAFLNPDFGKDLHDPFLLKDMSKAVERIAKAKESREKIGVFADYDADGIPGAALMARTLKHLGIEYEVFIPNREHGYGLSRDGIDFLIEQNSKLIITIDLGIRSFDEALYCQDRGVDLIVTDHHIPDDKLPQVLAVINPKQQGDKYPFKELCGCAVAYKLISALASKFTKIDEKFLKWNLDLVAISTISDVVPLLGENRTLAVYGLKVINKTQNAGLSELIRKSGLVDKELSAYHVGFQIGPRINAPGRIDHATKSYELLVTEDEEEARELATWLDEKNLERQEQMDAVEADAIARIEKNDLNNNNILIVAGKWGKGVIGPTASRISQKYSKPTILFAIEKEFYVGSARSVEGVHILELLESVDKLLHKYGGHSGAAGLSIVKENYQKFVDQLTQIANEKIDPKILVKKIKIDAELDEKDLSMKLYEVAKKLEPYGMGNPRPVFSIENIDILYPKMVGRDSKHLSFKTKAGDKTVKSIFFGSEFDLNGETTARSLAFQVDEDTWSGTPELSLNVVDIK